MKGIIELIKTAANATFNYPAGYDPEYMQQMQYAKNAPAQPALAKILSNPLAQGAMIGATLPTSWKYMQLGGTNFDLWKSKRGLGTVKKMIDKKQLTGKQAKKALEIAGKKYNLFAERKLKYLGRGVAKPALFGAALGGAGLYLYNKYMKKNGTQDQSQYLEQGGGQY